ncbi:olfactory receptor 51E1-like [Pangasianodon hypophthalmus]|uniref:olfactory receptor 51E1-like n=1 Tax=Pangasianodon hypophthalmus TaxID=310915 RepID=UPI002307CCDA|nr:olfactory receptor 51E1-like [Pangasianodon hypophthalmus]
MDYSDNVTYLILTGHVELEKYRYVYFLVTLSVYLMTICFNTIVIFVICTNERLHEPMYIFIIALLMNTLGGATAFYPKLLSDILSKNLIVSLDACVFQAFFIYTYVTSEFMLLSAMAYDRYVSICKPLQYAAIVKMSTVKKLIFLCCFMPSCENGIAVVLIYQLKLCNFKLNRIYCSNYAIVKLSCGDISAYNAYGLFIFVIAVFPQVIFIIYSYIRILAVCLKNSKDFRRKALQTCLPHLLIFTSFTVTSCFEIINSRLEGNMPHIIAMIMSVENLVIPPLLNPIIYGLKLQEIFNRIKKCFGRRRHIFLD